MLINQAALCDSTAIFAYSNRVFSATHGDVELAEKCLRSTAAVALFPARLPKPNFLINVSAVRPLLVLHFLQFERTAPPNVRSARVLDFACNYVLDSSQTSYKITLLQHLQEKYEIPTIRSATSALVRYFSSSDPEGQSYYWIFKNNIPLSKYMYSLNQSRLYFTSLGNVFVLDLVSGLLTRIYQLQPTDLFCQFFAPNKVFRISLLFSILYFYIIIFYRLSYITPNI